MAVYQSVPSDPIKKSTKATKATKATKTKAEPMDAPTHSRKKGKVDKSYSGDSMFKNKK